MSAYFSYGLQFVRARCSRAGMLCFAVTAVAPAHPTPLQLGLRATRDPGLIADAVSTAVIRRPEHTVRTYAEPTRKLGQQLVDRGWITGEQLIRGIQSQRMVGGRLGTCLLEMDVLTEDRLLDALSEQLKVPAARVEQLRGIEDETLKLLSPKVASRCQAVPFFSTRNQISVATLDVHDLGVLDELAFATNKKVVPHIANEVRVFEALEKYYGFELPKRYGHLLDRLNRSRYMWDESAKILFGKHDAGAPNDVVWSAAEDAFTDLPGSTVAPPSASKPGRGAPVRVSGFDPTPAGGFVPDRKSVV